MAAAVEAAGDGQVRHRGGRWRPCRAQALCGGAMVVEAAEDRGEEGEEERGVTTEEREEDSLLVAAGGSARFSIAVVGIQMSPPRLPSCCGGKGLQQPLSCKPRLWKGDAPEPSD